ncbi:MAG TPA: transglycosylase SLT domain-containing protein [Burkholderiaceae bacterium]|nr:transglycosylase SLT domain-containing protein [Burkholderiaceae bacterium]
MNVDRAPSRLRRAAAVLLLCSGFAGCASVAPGGPDPTGAPRNAGPTAEAASASAAPTPDGSPSGAAPGGNPPGAATPAAGGPTGAGRDGGPLPAGTGPAARGRAGPSIADAPVMQRERGPTDVPGAATGSLWDRIRAGFAMPELRSPLVDQRVRWYTARPDLLERLLERGAPYLYFIVEEVTRRGLPTELALLPFVESAMNPGATSHAAAAGLWQFIPATGRRFDLSQDWWIDERRDVVESTRAALDYLQEVHAMHGDDWFLALASYNWGEGAVARAVEANRRRGRPTDYASLRMPDETRHYVPKLLALKRVVAEASALGVSLPPVPDAPYFVTIEHPVPMDLKLAARFADMSVDEFVALNPSHNRPVIATNRNAEIRLPVDRVRRFVAASTRHAAQSRPFVTWRPHTLEADETVETNAERTGASAAEIRRANGLPADRRLRAGSRILVPAGGAADASVVESFEAAHLVFHPPPRAASPRGRRGAARDAGTARGRALAAHRPAGPAVRARTVADAPPRGAAAAARARTGATSVRATSARATPVRPSASSAPTSRAVSHATKREGPAPGRRR